MIKDTFALIKPFYKGPTKVYAYSMTLLLTSFAGLQVFTTYNFNTWRGRFYDAIQQYDINTFWKEMLVFSCLALVSILVFTFAQYSINLFALRWRETLTKLFIPQWLKVDRNQVESPDQRIQEDLKILTNKIADLYLGFMQAFVTILVFTAILWHLSYSVPVFGHYVPGLLLWGALISAVGGSAICMYAGRKVPKLLYNNQRAEANFRYKLVHARDGQKYVNSNLLSKFFNTVKDNYKILYNQYKYYNLAHNSYIEFTVIFPFAVAAPAYFMHLISLGILMQIAQGYGILNDAFNWLLERYLDIAELNSCTRRLTEFKRGL